MSLSPVGFFLWLSPLVLSPITVLELLLVFTAFRRIRSLCAIVFLLVLAALVGTYVICGGITQKATWPVLQSTEKVAPMLALVLNLPPGDGGRVKPTEFGFYSVMVHEYALKPKAVFPGTVVIGVKAAALNPADTKLFNKLPFVPYLRWVAPHALARDVAGVVVESACPEQFKVGDRVYGFTVMGAVAEYTVLLCNNMGKIPENASFESAAGAPVALSTAYGPMLDTEYTAHKLNKTSHVLVIGGGGGCGTVGAQLAKLVGVARVDCVASKRATATAKAAGCDTVYDYEDKDFRTKTLNNLKGKVDFVYDTVTAYGYPDYYESLNEVLTPNGIWYGLEALPKDHGLRLAEITIGKLIGKAFLKPKYAIITYIMNYKGYADIYNKYPAIFQNITVVDAGKAFNLDDVQRALQSIYSGKTHGKLVLKVK